MLLSRTRRNVKLAVKGLIFDGLDLQELMDVRRRRALEDSMGFHGQWDEHRRFQIAFLKEHGLQPQHDFLEIGCGPLTGGLPIIRYLEPNRYVGIDIRSSVIDLAWQEIGLAKLGVKNPRLICSSSFGQEELMNKKFDFIFSFSVLYHLSDPILREYFDTVAHRLKPRGICVAQVNTHLDSSGWLQFPFLKRTIDNYAEAAGAAGLTSKNLGPIDKLGFKLGGAERLNEMIIFQNVQRE